MYVCLCKGVTDQDIRDAVNGGIDTVRGVREKTGAMSKCGKCATLAVDIINDTLQTAGKRPNDMFFEVA